MKVQVSRPLSGLSIAAFAAYCPDYPHDGRRNQGRGHGEGLRHDGRRHDLHDANDVDDAREAVPCRRSRRSAQGRSQDHRGANAGME